MIEPLIEEARALEPEKLRTVPANLSSGSSHGSFIHHHGLILDMDHGNTHSLQ
jgi:hypothetical protein